jgi:hypothetical protein
MGTCAEAGVAAPTSIDGAARVPAGTWTLDPARSVFAFARRMRRREVVTGRLPAWGVVHLDGIPPAGAVRFRQPSGLPVMTLALDAAGVATQQDSQERWWLLGSESLEVLPTGTWRVMATLTAHGASTLVELHLEVRRRGLDWLVLRGHGAADRHAPGGGGGAWLDAMSTFDLALLARRVVTPSDAEGADLSGWTDRVTAARATPGSAASSGRPRPAARRSGWPGRPRRGGGR